MTRNTSHAIIQRDVGKLGLYPFRLRYNYFSRRIRDWHTMEHPEGKWRVKWFREGLPLIGEKTTMRWLGSSVVELKIPKAKDPFRNAETLVVFEPRDVLLLWAYTRARGRRDMLIFRAQLRTRPNSKWKRSIRNRGERMRLNGT